MAPKGQVVRVTDSMMRRVLRNGETQKRIPSMAPLCKAYRRSMQMKGGCRSCMQRRSQLKLLTEAYAILPRLPEKQLQWVKSSLGYGQARLKIFQRGRRRMNPVLI